MTPELWSRLPLLVVACVIDETTDELTIDSWCHATRHNRYLYRAALARKYLQCSYNHKDLLDDPNEPAEPILEHRRGFRHWLQVEALEEAGELEKTGRISTTVSKDGKGLTPAKMIRHLYLDFTLPFLDSGNCIDNDAVRAYVPTVHKLAYNASLLFPLLERLRSLFIDGVAPQEMLDAMKSIPSPNLQCLTYRYTSPSTRRPSIPKYDDLFVNWDSLAHLTSLRHLVIQELGSDDGWSLARSIASLSQLERLELVITRSKPSQTRESPMIGLIRGLFPSSRSVEDDAPELETCQLPSGLKVLKIVDNWESPVFGVERPTSAAMQTFAYHSLTDVSIDLQDSDSVANMLAWLGQPPIAQLSINSGKQENNYMEAPDNLEYTSHVDHILQDYQPTLRSLRLLSAWEANPDLAISINKEWAGQAAITDVVLGSKSRLAYKSHLANRHDLNTLEHVLFGYAGPDETHRWGSKLERARIEQVDMRSFAVEDESTADLPSLKVLQINPIGTPWDMDEEKLLSFTEGKLATQLVALFPSLRVITIQKYTYWVQHQNDGYDTDGIRLWDFAEALANPVLKAIVADVLKPEDYELLRMRGEDYFENEACAPVDVQSCREKNYMILRPVKVDRRR